MSGITVTPSVFTAIIQDGNVLLIRRFKTGWMDGYYDLPAGHLEDQESLQEGAVRELEEETGVIANPKDLELIHLHQNHNNPENPHYGYIFIAKKWSGTPALVEPEKSDDVGFFAINDLPKKMLPYSHQAVTEFVPGQITTSYHPPGSIKKD
jgi:8-oxo-dGTP diphosphatase